MGQQHATPAINKSAPLERISPPAQQPIERAESPDLGTDESVPVMFKWTHGGQRVHLTGTFNNWASEGIPMVRSGQEFYQVVQVPRGVHEYKFLVDGEWKFSLDQPVLQDLSGNVNNVVDIQYYEKYEPAPLQDPLEIEEDEGAVWGQEILDALQTEPPTAPPLLVKLPLLGIPSAKKADASRILSSGPNQNSAVNIPLFSICGHVVHDSSSSFRPLGSDVVVSTASVRFAQKFSTTVLLTLNNSARSDGLLRHYGVIPSVDATSGRAEKQGLPVVPQSSTSHVFHKALLGKGKVSFRAAAQGPASPGLLKRANSSGSESPGNQKPLDLSTFTD